MNMLSKRYHKWLVKKMNRPMVKAAVLVTAVGGVACLTLVVAKTTSYSVGNGLGSSSVTAGANSTAKIDKEPQSVASRLSLSKSNATSERPIRLMPLGDSITGGQGDSSLESESGGYRTRLWERLINEDKLNIDFVGSIAAGPAELGDRDHEGHNGWCIAEPCYVGQPNIVLNKLVASWLQQAKPDVILLHAGTNDLSNGAESGTAVANLDVFIAQIYRQLPDVHLIAAQIVLTPALQEGQQAADYNAAIPAIADKYRSQGKKISVVDMAPVLTRPEDFNDPSHPSRQGYQKMADAWYMAIKAVY